MELEAASPFKDYSNPHYDVVDDEEAWLNGLCCIFAHALVERFSLPLKALLVRTVDDPSNKTLVHAFGVLPDGRFVDARGVMSEAEMRESYEDYTQRDWQHLHCARSGELVELVFEDVTVGHLWALNPEDIDATNAAHQHMAEHPDRFEACAST